MVSYELTNLNTTNAMMGSGAIPDQAIPREFVPCCRYALLLHAEFDARKNLWSYDGGQEGRTK